MSELGEFDDQRRRIIRRITLLTWGLWGAAAALALAGGALLAWMFRGLGGLSFAALWVMLALVLVAIPAGMHVVMRAMERRGARANDQMTNEGGDANGG